MKNTLVMALTLACGAAGAAPELYNVDPNHTYPSFEADHMGGLSVWRGKFKHTTGTISLDRAAATGTIHIIVDTKTLDFGNDRLNEHAQGPEIFDVAKYPTATFEGKISRFEGNNPTEVRGELTMHGATKPLILTIGSFLCKKNPMTNKEVCGADASATFNRSDFGISFGREMGFRQEVKLAIQVEAVKAPIRAVGAPSSPTYSVTSRISGSGKAWDYAVIDETSSRLYLAQQGVTVLDLKTGKLTTGLVSGKMTHGVAVLGDGTLAVDDAATKTVTVFNGADGSVVATIPTAEVNPVNGGHALDAILLEPTSGLVVAINGESGLLVLIDVRQAKVAGTISIGGHPEFAVADGKGRVYVNVEGKKRSEIVDVDIASRKLVQKIPLKDCEGPTGLAYDQGDDLLISVCGDNGVTKFIHAADGHEAASIKVGKGADAVMFDPQRHLAFVPGAEKGTLSVIAVRSAADIAVVQTVTTQKGTRLGAVDTTSGRVYLPAAQFGPPVPPIPYPSVVPGTFEILVMAPN